MLKNLQVGYNGEEIDSKARLFVCGIAHWGGYNNLF